MGTSSKQKQLRSPIDKQADLLASAYAVPPHIHHIDDVLQRLVIRELRKEGYAGAIIEVPPRHGKSELCSHNLPAWYLGAFPDERIVLCSYEADFAATWGRKARNSLERYGPAIFGTSVAHGSSAADRWDIHEAEGGMITAGVGGAITGRGADVLIIDDPVKNSQEANSRILRERTWEWYQSTARTRLEPGGVILIIMTRWHEDDLAGRLLREQEEDSFADKFLRVRLPALAEEDDPLKRDVGAPLWPERYNEAALEKIRASVGSYVWSALFQQRPAPRSGGMFSRDNFQIVQSYPRNLKKVVRFWDFASTDKKRNSTPDYTAGVKMGISQDKRVFILDCTRFQGNPRKVEKAFRHAAAVDGRGTKIRIEKERGSAGTHVVDIYARFLPGYDVKGVLPSGDKEVRAGPYSAASERGDIFLVEGPWIEEFLQEHESFPFAANDDQVDAASHGYEFLVGKRTGVFSW
jgi:predicted phage terminase large subunit-like protein